MEIRYENLIKMDLDELYDLNNMVIEVLKVKTDLLGKKRVAFLSIGDEFKVDHKNHGEQIFIVEKINKKRVIGKNKVTGLRYNIPFEMVEKINN